MRTGEWEDLSSNFVVRFGQLVESWIADTASTMIDRYVFKCPYYLGWRNGTWLTCSKDFHVKDDGSGERWAMECKSTSSFGTKSKLGRHLSSDTAPAYAIQCYHQMIVDELDGVFNPVLIMENRHPIPNAVSAIESGVPVSEVMKEIPWSMRVFVIKRDEEACTQILNYLKRCRELFEAGGSPPSDSSEYLNTFLKSKDRTGEFVEADDKTANKIERIKSLKDQAKGLAEEAKYIESELLRQLDDCSGYTYNGSLRMHVRPQESNRIDTARLKQERPEIAEEFSKVSVSNIIKYPS